MLNMPVVQKLLNASFSFGTNLAVLLLSLSMQTQSYRMYKVCGRKLRYCPSNCVTFSEYFEIVRLCVFENKESSFVCVLGPIS